MRFKTLKLKHTHTQFFIGKLLPVWDLHWDVTDKPMSTGENWFSLSHPGILFSGNLYLLPLLSAGILSDLNRYVLCVVTVSERLYVYQSSYVQGVTMTSGSYSSCSSPSLRIPEPLVEGDV